MRKIENGNQPGRCTHEREIDYLKDYIVKRFKQLNDIIENTTVDFINQEVKSNKNPGGMNGVDKGPGKNHTHQGGGAGNMGNRGEIDETFYNNYKTLKFVKINFLQFVGTKTPRND